MIRLIDSHAHLCDSRITNAPLEVLHRVISVGYDVKSSLKNVELAQKNQKIYAAVGVHPSDVKGLKDSDLDTLLGLTKNERVVAYGEIGLDYHYENTDKNKQIYWLERQLDLVEACALPAIIHERDCHADMLNITKRNINKFKASAVMHCFSGSVETAREYVDLGFYISFSGVITFANAKKYADIIRSVPREKLLIETDCPYLTPEPYRGKINQPANVYFMAQRVAEVLGESCEYVAELTAQNTYTLFNKMR